jgi:hypothetical protein
MEISKIYITLKEAENLIFKRFLIIPNSRLKVTKAKELFSINIWVNNLGLVKIDEHNLTILFSAINTFEIPEVEKSLFNNNFFIPAGMIKEISRKFKDETDTRFFKSEEMIETIQFYSHLRNGFVGVYKELITNNNKNSVNTIGNNFFQIFKKLTPFKSAIIKEFIVNNDFPLLQFDPNTFRANRAYRVAWFLKKTSDILINGSKIAEEKTEKQKASTKEWFKDLLNNNNTVSLPKFIATIPEELTEEQAFIIGYYFVAFNNEELLENPKSIKSILEVVPANIKEETYLWAYFFFSMLNKNILRLFFLKSFQSNAINLEKLALHTALNIENKTSDFIFSDLEFINLPLQNQISELWELKYGVQNANPTIVPISNVIDIFNNALSPNKINNIAIVVSFIYNFLNLFSSRAWLNKKTFALEMKNPTADFYGDITPENEDFLKKFNIKPKPFSKLIDPKKKVLVVFISNDKSLLLNFYVACLGDTITSQFDKVLCIWLVKEKLEDILTPKFSLEKDELKRKIENAFDNKVPVELIVKNWNNPNENEIKRNCFNALKGYKISEIEVVHENFDTIQAQWLLHGNTEFYIQDKPKNLYVYYNSI